MNDLIKEQYIQNPLFLKSACKDLQFLNNAPQQLKWVSYCKEPLAFEGQS